MAPSPPNSRPFTPDSLLTLNSLEHATSTIDDLTLALTNFSRVSSPEPPSVLSCCCGRGEGECENLRAWLDRKVKLESRLTLSAEVGQALLQRHDAYLRRQGHERPASQISTDDSDSTEDGYSTQSDTESRISELLIKNAALERRLTQALVNTEVTEVSNKTILQELQEAKETVSRLSAHHARSLGWDNRVNAVVKERDDMQQERDFESQRARIAESRFAALKEKASKLQGEVRRLQDELRQKRMHRLESSESIIQDARSQIESLHRTIGSPGQTAAIEQEELSKVLETLVDENDALKRDNAELSQFLADSREELRTVQEELDEQRANQSIRPSVPHTPSSSTFRQHHHHHHYSGSMPSATLREHITKVRGGAPPPTSAEFNKTHQSRPSTQSQRTTYSNFEPLTPETSIRPLSPGDSTSQDSRRGSVSLSFNNNQPAPPRSPYKIEFDEMDGGGDEEEASSEYEKRRVHHKPLLLLSRSRGVQTDPIPIPIPITETGGGLHPPSPTPYLRSHPSTPSPNDPDPRSETSSVSETLTFSSGGLGTGGSVVGGGGSTPMSLLITQITLLITRMTQADAQTLTNRLKRQHLLPSSISSTTSSSLTYLSRTTINTILSDLASLRSSSSFPFRAYLDDESKVMVVTRKELRGLFKVFRDLMGEWGVLRGLVNEVVMDPITSPKVREVLMAGGGEETQGKEEKEGKEGAGWMGGISKLLSSSPAPAPTTQAPPLPLGLARSTSGRGNARPPTKMVPKLQPATGASATTVEVEFLGRVGVATSSTSTRGRVVSSGSGSGSGFGGEGQQQQTQTQTGGGGGVMALFAGAPTLRTGGGESWVVLPSSSSASTATSTSTSGLRRISSSLKSPGAPPPTLRTQTLRQQNINTNINRGMNRLSRNVDAVIDFASLSVVGEDDGDVGLDGGVGVGQDGDGDGDGDEEDEEGKEGVGPLLAQRTLRRRGMSDSSIRSTYLEDGITSPTAAESVGGAGGGGGGQETKPMASYQWPISRPSMFQSLTRRVGGWGVSSSSSAASSSPARPSPRSSAADHPHRHQHQHHTHHTHQEQTSLTNLLANWSIGTPNTVVDPLGEFVVGSPPGGESSLFERTRRGTKDFY